MDARTRLVEKSCRAAEVRVVRVYVAGRTNGKRSLNMAGHKIPHLYR